MSESHKLSAEIRTEFGKGFARRLRAAGKIPAVIYGHGTEPQHVALPGHETALILRKKNAILDLDIDGKSELALVKDVQKDPVRQIIEHVDLLVVRRGEKVTVSIPVHLEGESFSGTIATLDAATLEVEAEATHIPESVSVDIDGAEDGTHVLAKDVKLPKGVTLVTDPETLVVAVSLPAASVSAEADAAEAAEAPAADADAAE